MSSTNNGPLYRLRTYFVSSPRNVQQLLSNSQSENFMAFDSKQDTTWSVSSLEAASAALIEAENSSIVSHVSLRPKLWSRDRISSFGPPEL